MTRTNRKSFARTALATTLAAALTLSPMTVAPAEAGNQEDQAAAIAVGSLFALLTAGLVASSLRHPGGVSITTDHHGAAPAVGRGDRGRGDGRRDGRHGNARKILPEQCQFTVRHGRDRGTYYSRHCLKRNFDHWAYLPARCEEKAWVPRRGRNVNAYDATCLGRFGYRDSSSRRTGRN